METNNFTPQQSIELITQVITEARTKLEENGFIYIFWGGLIAFAGFTQFALLKNEQFDINWYPYLLMPFGAVFTGLYYARKESKNKQNLISKMISTMWIVLSINMMILGFLFGGSLGKFLIPMILILLSIGTIVTGTSLKSMVLIYAGIFVGLSAFVCLQLDILYHSLVMGVVALIAFLFPGILFMLRRKQ